MNDHAEKLEEGGGGVLAEGIRLDEFLPYLMNRITNRLNVDLSEAWRDMRVTTQHWRVLAVLNARDGRNIGELAVYTVTEQSTLSRIVDRMQQEGLVERRTDARDGRVVPVFLTAAGRETFKRILPIAFDHYRRAVAGLSEEELKTLTGLLNRILMNVRRSPYS